MFDYHHMTLVAFLPSDHTADDKINGLNRLHEQDRP